ncbi:hypothetical protein ACFV0T_26900 [Streptomyces sp. NPDC059582]|uniref:hypothetical protein n=1 Tax=Streptomyces sp. NPDC059582 TaxID=3346875 RepID=UPI00369C8F7D
MEGTALFNTPLGALIAWTASAFFERRRRLRGSMQRAREDRRSAYPAFLVATAAGETSMDVARGHDNDATASARSGTVLRDSSVLFRRREPSLVADESVLDEVTRTVALLRTYRDVVAQGLLFEAEEVQQARAAFDERRDRLTRVMRESL